MKIEENKISFLYSYSNLREEDFALGDKKNLNISIDTLQQTRIFLKWKL